MYLECKECVKYLGVLTDYKLSWKNHVYSIALQISKTIGLLSKLRHFVPHHTLVNICNSLITPYLRYGLTVWGQASKTHSTRVREHLSSDKSSHIFKHLQSSERCRQSCSADCFEILDSAPTKFQLKLEEAMHINWEKPNLNQQVHHVNLTLTL